MEITAPGTINLEDYRLSSASAVHNTSGFAEILERARAANDASRDEVSGAGVSGRAETGAFRPSARTPIDKDDKLYQLCLELETFLVKNLLSSMRNTVQKSGLIDDSFAGKMYEDMLYDEYAKDFTKNAGFGLAEQAYRQLNGLWG